MQRVAGSPAGRACARPSRRCPTPSAGCCPGSSSATPAGSTREVREDFRTVGLTHLTAVSGTNVAIVAGAVLLLCPAARASGCARAPVLAAVALAGFVVLARPSPSVLRAAVMGVVGLVALSTGSRRAALPALATAVLVLVLVDPDLAATPGFALSVLATGRAAGARAAVARARWRRRLPGWLADALAVPAAAQVACGPVVVAISLAAGAAVGAGEPAGRAGRRPRDRDRRGGRAARAGVAAGGAGGGLAGLAADGLAGRWSARTGAAAARAPRSPGRTALRGALLLAGLTARAAARRCAAAGAAALVLLAGDHRRRGGRGRPGGRPAGLAAARLVPRRLRRRPGRRASCCAPAPAAAVVVDAGPDPAAVDRCLRPARRAPGAAACCSPTCTPTTSTGCPACCAGGRSAR